MAPQNMPTRRCSTEGNLSRQASNMMFIGSLRDIRVPPFTYLTFEEGTQTETEFRPASQSSQASLDLRFSDDSEGVLSESVMEKLSRGVYRFLRSDRCDRGTQTAKDPMTWETERLAFDIVFYTLGRRPSNSDDKVVRCLRGSVVKMLENHSFLFNGMMARLNLNSDIQEGFTQMADELFGLNNVTWGKVIALFAFGARLAQHCHNEGMPDLVLDIVAILSQFAVEKLTPFLRENGGWATLCDAFPAQSDYEGQIWRSLLIAGIGLTAIAAFVALHR